MACSRLHDDIRHFRSHLSRKEAEYARRLYLVEVEEAIHVERAKCGEADNGQDTTSGNVKGILENPQIGGSTEWPAPQEKLRW